MPIQPPKRYKYLHGKQEVHLNHPENDNIMLCGCWYESFEEQFEETTKPVTCQACLRTVIKIMAGY